MIPMVAIENLKKNFGDLEVLRGIDLVMGKGEVVAVIGPSGSGKSTLLRCMNWLETPTSGSIEIAGVQAAAGSATKATIHRLRQTTAMVFQNYHLFKNKTALENIMEPLTIVQKVPKKEAEERSMALLAQVGLAEKKDTYPSHLSGGQQQRIGIARALAVNPSIILMDEPTSALDPELVGEVLDVIRSLAEQHMTMIIVTHEMQFARQAADRVLFMDGGVILEDRPPAELFAAPEHPRTAQFLEQVRI